MRQAICRLSTLEHSPSSEHRSRLCQGFGSFPPDPASAHTRCITCLNLKRTCWLALVFYFYASFAWRNTQAVEIDPMRTSAGWLAGELRPPKHLA
jgi:hypothetical protein